MRHLTLGDLKLGLNDLFETRKSHLEATQMGQAYGELLLIKRTAINMLPESLTSGRALTDQLTETDAEHDGWGGAIWHLTEAILRVPSASPELKAKAFRIRKAFIAKLGALREGWADEAAAADRNRPKAEELAAELKSIPTPTGETVEAWVLAFLAAGDKLGKLLNDRAFVEAAGLQAGEIASLWMTTLGLLSRFRTGLADVMAGQPDLPRNLDALIFGFFDELNDRRANATKVEATLTPPPAGETMPTEPDTTTLMGIGGALGWPPGETDEPSTETEAGAPTEELM